MPQGPVTNPFMKPFVVLALPGMYLFYKYNQYRRKKKESAKRRLTERELQHLNNKIDKLLNKLEESEPELATCPEEECVICINAKATMQTAPCGHQVVCRKCFVKTIQIAVSQRLLPLRCVICRAKILRLKTGSVLPTSASGYSVNSRSSSVPQSDSLYSVSSGGSSISSSSCASSDAGGVVGGGGSCCGGHHCSGGAYPRQPQGSGTAATPLYRRTASHHLQYHHHAVKMKLQDYCRPDRLPPIKESPYSGSPSHSVTAPTPPPSLPSTSTRLRCAQKIVTQLETVPLLGKKQYKYEKLPQNEEDATRNRTESEETSRRRWWKGISSGNSPGAEKDDNRRNELVEKVLELKEKPSLTRRIRFSKDAESVDLGKKIK